jgi:NAD(P)-dependent dehydrogenase (short-subunit alcohol dehydrogenase family)
MPNTIDLANRFAVVTGGAQGIGRAITSASSTRRRGRDLGPRQAFAEKTARELDNRGRTSRSRAT